MQRQETGDERQETGDEIRQAGDKRWEAVKFIILFYNKKVMFNALEHQRINGLKFWLMISGLQDWLTINT